MGLAYRTALAELAGYVRPGDTGTAGDPHVREDDQTIVAHHVLTRLLRMGLQQGVIRSTERVFHRSGINRAGKVVAQRSLWPLIVFTPIPVWVDALGVARAEMD
jgi:hypothetical protein